jgi:hypothetical protein
MLNSKSFEGGGGSVHDIRNTSARREIITVRGQSCLASSKILTPPSPATKALVHTRGSGGEGDGGGVNILEDARHRIGLLQ